MSTVYLASFKGTSKGAFGLFNRITRFFTKGPYSHSELCIGSPFDGDVLCISSDPIGGVRGKVMSLSRDEYDLLPLPTVYAQQALNFLNDNRGAPYDAIGCIRSVLPFVGREHPTKFFCSEVAATIIGFTEPWRMHPNALHMVMTEKK